LTFKTQPTLQSTLNIQTLNQHSTNTRPPPNPLDRGIFTRPKEGTLTSGVAQEFKDRAVAMAAAAGAQAASQQRASTTTAAPAAAAAAATSAGTKLAKSINSKPLPSQPAGQVLAASPLMLPKFQLVSTSVFSVIEIGGGGGGSSSGGNSIPVLAWC
jgi:hypothetical protein